MAREGSIPEPLEDSPKCPGCSLVGICLPDETGALRARAVAEPLEQLRLFAGEEAPRKPPRTAGEIRRLVTPRCEQRPLYLNKQGLRVGKSGEGAAGQGERQAGGGGTDRRVVPGEPVRQCAVEHAGGADAVRGGRADLLFFAGRLVLRDHERV